MSLPKMKTPTYELIVPSTKEKVKFRPFLVMEQKALLISQQSEDPMIMTNTLRDIIDVCTFKKLDVNALAMFDIEYIFIQLRARSVGETSELNFNCLECNDANAKVKIPIDLLDLKVTFDPEHTKDIKLGNGIGLIMKYPSIEAVTTLRLTDVNDVNSLFNIMISCIDSIYDATNVYKATDHTKEELETFMNELTNDQFIKVQAFFSTMPKLEKVIEFDCPVCGFHHTHRLSGIDSFF